MTFGKPLKMGVGCQGEPTRWLDKLLVPKLLVWERSWRLSLIINSHWFNQSCLCNDAFVNIPQVWDSESFWVDEHTEVLGGWRTQKGHGSFVPLPHILPYACLPSGYSWVITFCNKLAIVSKLSFVSRSAKDWNWGGGLGNLRFIAGLSEHRWQLGLVISVWRWAVLWGWGLNPWVLC